MDLKEEQLKTMPITSHLLELRKRILLILLGIVVCVLALSPFMQSLFDYASAPLMQSLPKNTQLLAVGVTAPVMGPLKVLLFIAFYISLPFTIYQVWMFLLPALYKKEKRVVISMIVSSFFMFTVGIAYCYFVVFKMVFSFIATFSPESISFAPDISSYISFVLHMFFAFGLTFELPVAVLVLCFTRCVQVQDLARYRKYVIVAAFAISAVITPPDVFSQLLLALPIVLLYECSIVLSKLFIKRESQALIQS